MARIAGVNIPTNKRVIIALQYIHGIGAKKAEEICEKVQHSGRPPRLPADRRRSPADPRDDRPRLSWSRAIFAAKTAINIKRLMDLGCYRGLRHRRQLPVRGQRTHTNARTRKGKAKPIAGKKK